MARKKKKSGDPQDNAGHDAGFDDIEADFFAMGDDEFSEEDDLGWGEEWDGVPGASDAVASDFDAAAVPTAQEPTDQQPDQAASEVEPTEEYERPAALAPEEPSEAAPLESYQPESSQPESPQPEPPPPTEPDTAELEPTLEEGGDKGGGQLFDDEAYREQLIEADAPDERPDYRPATLRVPQAEAQSQPAAPAPVPPPPQPPAAPARPQHPPPEPQAPLEAPELGPREEPPDEHGDEALAWWYAAVTLEKEAELAADPLDRARRMAAAAGIYRDRTGDWGRSEALFRAARDAGLDSSDILRDLADLVAAREDFEGLKQLLEQRAGLLDDPQARTEAYQDAALVARNNLRNDPEAVRLLEAAIESDAEDYFSLRLLRDMYLRLEAMDALPAVLERMASLAGGGLAAEYHVERGQVLESRLSRDQEALQAYLDAREADPSYGPAFLSLERHYRRTESWAELADLYLSESELGEGPEARYWASKAAHTFWGRAQDGMMAAKAFERMVELDIDAPQRIEYRAFLSAMERWPTLVDQLRFEADRNTGTPAALLLFEAGYVLEFRLGRSDEACEAYRAALAADPQAVPAAEAIARISAAEGDYQSCVELWEKLVLQTADLNQLISLRYQLAETYEHQLEEDELARQHYEAIIEQTGSYLPALEGLERVYRRLGLNDELAALLEQRAILSDDPEDVALHLYRAGAIWERGSTDPEKATEFFIRALQNVPNHPYALDAASGILTENKQWTELAGVLHRAAQASRDGDEAVSLFYAAGRIHADRLSNPHSAIACLRSALELSPGFLPARILLRNLLMAQGDDTGTFGLLRAEADATEDVQLKSWLLYQALVLGYAVPEANPKEIAEEILRADPLHSAAQEILVRQALQAGDRLAAAEILRQKAAREDDGAQALATWCHAAHLLAEAEDSVAALQAFSMVLADEPAEPQPFQAISRICEGLGYWEEAALALEMAQGPGVARNLARLRELYLHDAPAALALYQQAVDEQPNDLVACLGVERLLTGANDHAALARIHASLVNNTESAAVRSLHALLGAHLFEGIEDLDNARELYQAALSARPGRGKAFDGMLRVLVAQGDSESLRLLFLELGIESGMDLANALVDVGDLDGAILTLQRSLDEEQDVLPFLLCLERLYAEGEQWREVFDCLSKRHQLVEDEETRAWTEQAQRRVLAEHLADTDDAWEFYRTLHEQDPADAEILEALADISVRRDEVELALQYLEQRAEVAVEADEKVSTMRRMAQIQRGAGELDAARDTYLQALNLLPDDLESLDGLQTLAEEGADWRTVVGILARKAVLFEAEEQVEIYASIARIWEAELKEPAVANESWRKVLELDEAHQEALSRLVALVQEAGDWKGFVSYGESLSQLLTGEDRSALLRRIGLVYESELNSVNDAVRFLDAASGGAHPDADAARARERIHAERGEWEQVVQALISLANATEGEEKLESLLKAARIRTNTLHNRAAASDIYAMVLDVAPDDAEALRFQCEQLFEAGEYESAVELFERLEPIESERDLDDFDEQIEVAQFFFNFGEALRALDRHDEAMARFEYTLELNDTHLPSLQALGPIYVERAEWNKGERIYRKLIQLTGGRGEPGFLADIYTNLGHIQRHLGDLEKARKRFNKALEKRPNDIDALLGLAAVQRDRGEWNNLLNVYNNVIFHARERRDVIKAYLAKGFVLDQKLNLPGKAADHYRKSLNFNPNEPRALVLLAELALRKQDATEARKLVEAAAQDSIEDSVIESNLLLVKAIAALLEDSSIAAQQALELACGTDVTLPDALVEVDATSPASLGEVLRARLANCAF